MQNFWENLPKPFFALAPMADVTDPVFRKIVAKYSRHGEEGGGPDVFWTEFVSCDGLMTGGRDALMRDLAFTQGEKPIVAQLFTSKPENMKKAAALCAELGFDGIDINMGCPDRSICKQLCGAEMINHPQIAKEVIRAAKEGAPGLPISVKTRIGYNKPDIDGWIKFLLEQDIAVLSVHVRTKKELSKVPANWEYMKEIVKLRDSMGLKTLLVGNGDVHSIRDGIQKAQETGCDGVMIGRAIFGNPWLFDKKRSILKEGRYMPKIVGKILPRRWVKKIEGDSRYTISEVSVREKLEVLKEHTSLFEKELGDIKNFAIMKKHFKAYINGFEGAKELRVRLMSEATDSMSLSQIIDEFLKDRKVS
ncbi:tRNA-dihydrouridine synthase [Candidatus Nomurabacteria bacterium]|nr:tRNA-dihydrouridine synthase [Candidatus Nomurabacteria bacterium]